MVEEANNNERTDNTDTLTNDNSSNESEDEWEDNDHKDNDEVDHGQPIAGVGKKEQQVPAEIAGVHKEQEDEQELLSLVPV